MRAFSCLVGLLATFFLSAAPAHAQLTTVKVPDTVYVGISVNVTFDGGSSLCGAVTADYGDPAGSSGQDHGTKPEPQREAPFRRPAHLEERGDLHDQSQRRGELHGNGDRRGQGGQVQANQPPA